MAEKLKKYYHGGILFVLLSWALIVIIASIIFSFSPYQYITSLLIDDAAYYPILARNIALGYGSTFDAITLTNGYHPLWCWLNIPFSLLSGNVLGQLFIFKTLLIIVILAMLAIWHVVLKKTGLSNHAIAVFLLLMGASYWWSVKVYYSGMETALVTFFMGLSLLALMKLYDQYCRKNAIVLGFVLAAAFLSRLDSIFFVGIVFSFWLCKRKKIDKEMLCACIAFLMAALPYVLWNKLMFGGFIPLSGIKKSCFGLNGIINNLNSFKYYFHNEMVRIAGFMNIYVAAVCIIVFIVIIGYLVVKNKGMLYAQEQGRRNIFSIIYLSAITHFIYNVLFMSEITVSWYQYLIYLSLFVAAAVCADFCVGSNNRPSYVVFYIATVTLMVIMLMHGFGKYPRVGNAEIAQAAIVAKNSFPARSIFGMCDPGIFRLVSGRKTIGFNGLIGNRDIMQLSATGRPEEIVKKYKVDYYVIILPETDLQELTVKPLYISRKINIYWQGRGYQNSYVIIAEARSFFKEKHKL